ncbi:MAG: hypothetical protein L0Z73_11955 [Gammaproteobacteria bacterium]|nr:hypothetical protein [Gammaproteobacteria bacterium]
MKFAAGFMKYSVSSLFLAAILIGCGGDDGEVIGTGGKPQVTINGTAAVGAPLALSPVTVKAEDGVKSSTTTNASGNFQIEVRGDGPFLMKVDRGNGTSLYSIAGGGGTTNIHPFTDLIIRNWFKVQGLDVETEFSSAVAPALLPSSDDIEAIKNAIKQLITQALLQFTVPDNLDLISTPFAANSTGFDLFLEYNLVVINNNQLTIVLTDQATSISNEIVSNLALNTDFTQADGAPPSTPANLRAVPASGSEIIVVWDPSTDNIGVVGYNIYRNSALVRTTPYPVLVDGQLEQGISYCYEVEAFDSAGNNSPRAEITDNCPQTLGSNDNTPPAPPTALQATALGANTIALTWQQSGINDVYGFRIYRGTTPANINIGTPVATVTATSHSDFNLFSASQYCYQVSAFDAAGNESARSAPPVCATTAVGSNPPPTGTSTVEFSTASYQASEADATVLITVNRNGDPSEAISVEYATTAGTATNDRDFFAANGTLTWGANDISPKTFRVQIKGDALDSESTETVMLALSNPSSNTGLGANSNATLSISNNVCSNTLSQDVTVDTVISASCTRVANYIDILNNATLTINPGVTLIFESGTGLNAQSDGTLVAVGSAPQPILFTGLQPLRGYWSGIQFTFSNNLNELDHLTIEYGGGGQSSNGNANIVMFGVEASAQNLSLRNTTVSESAGYGFEFNNGSNLQAFSNITATRNTLGPGILPANKIGVLDNASRFTGNDRDEMIVISFTNVTSNQTWPAIDVPYSMGYHNIYANVAIQAGATLIFGADGGLNVQSSGSLSAVGTAENQIVFTADQPLPGRWAGIQYTFSNSILNELDYAIVEYGGAAINGTANVVMFGVGASVQSLKLTNSILRNSSGYGFEFDQASQLLEFNNNVITDNAVTGRIYADNVYMLDTASLYDGNTNDSVFIEDGSVATTQTWPAINVPYSAGSHNVNSNAQLTIAPGSTLIFRGGGFINVSQTASLTANGTADAPINFTAEQASPGYWQGIQFTFSNNLNNILNFVTVNYGGGAGGNGAGNVRLFGVGSGAPGATITNSALQNSATYGIWLSADAQVNADVGTSNTFLNNVSGTVFREP